MIHSWLQQNQIWVCKAEMDHLVNCDLVLTKTTKLVPIRPIFMKERMLADPKYQQYLEHIKAGKPIFPGVPLAFQLNYTKYDIEVEV